MHPRLNVTEAERLCYSRRKLQAISALRNADIDPTIFGLHKDYRVPGVRGKVYLVQNPQNSVFVFPTLAEVLEYAAVCQEWKMHPPRIWSDWLKAPAKPAPRRALCSWPKCRYCADGMLEGQLFCRFHAYSYERRRQARDPRASLVATVGLPASFRG